MEHISFEASADASGEKKETREATINTSVFSLGPATINPHLFDRALRADPRSWSIIDRGGLTSLTPIWTIMSRNDNPLIQRATDIMREVWLEKAHELLRLPMVVLEYDRVRVSVLQPSIHFRESANDRSDGKIASISLRKLTGWTS